MAKNKKQNKPEDMLVEESDVIQDEVVEASEMEAADDLGPYHIGVPVIADPSDDDADEKALLAQYKPEDLDPDEEPATDSWYGDESDDSDDFMDEGDEEDDRY